MIPSLRLGVVSPNFVDTAALIEIHPFTSTSSSDAAPPSPAPFQKSLFLQGEIDVKQRESLEVKDREDRRDGGGGHERRSKEERKAG